MLAESCAQRTVRVPELSSGVRHPALRTPGGGEVRVSLELVVRGADVRTFHALYEEAFGPLRSQAVARQVLHRGEFADQMADQRVWKFVVWDAQGRPLGLTTLTRDLTTVPWVSPEYFAVNFPEHARRNAIYYWGFTLTGPGSRRRGILAAMLAAVAEVVNADKGVCGYDICAYNNATLQLNERIEILSRDLADVAFQIIDSQTYYCAILS